MPYKKGLTKFYINISGIKIFYYTNIRKIFINIGIDPLRMRAKIREIVKNKKINKYLVSIISIIN